MILEHVSYNGPLYSILLMAFLYINMSSHTGFFSGAFFYYLKMQCCPFIESFLLFCLLLMSVYSWNCNKFKALYKYISKKFIENFECFLAHLKWRCTKSHWFMIFMCSTPVKYYNNCINPLLFWFTISILFKYIMLVSDRVMQASTN